ncbi:MAG: hypothetical protein K8T91_14120 [Planctomycetes bacterium]|nr:hypothetical protein [Planctomycetota bacterium]
MVDSIQSSNRVRRLGLLALLTIAIIFVLVALLGLIFPYSLALAIPAMGCALWVWKSTSQTNRAVRFAALAVGLSGGILFIGGGFWHFVRYQAEASPGYLRVNFDETFREGRFGEITAKSLSLTEIPAGIQLLIDQNICVKGCAFPPSRRSGMTQFVMLQESKPFRYGSIEVVLRKGQQWSWTRDPVAVSGKLILNPEYRSFRFLTDDGRFACKYLLIDAVVRPATTPFGLSKRPRSSC